MTRYRNTHLWLLLPFAVAVLGFVPSYWLRFFEVPWRHHVHGLTATLWFVLLVAQPYLISRGHAAQHRRYGMLALIVAGLRGGGWPGTAKDLVSAEIEGGLPGAARVAAELLARAFMMQDTGEET